MRSILISIQPQWVKKILNGEKTIEIRKTTPKCTLPIKVYIYCTKGTYKKDVCAYNCKVNEKGYSSCEFGNGKVVAEFTLNKITDLRRLDKNKMVGTIMLFGGMNMGDYEKYNGRYAWHVDDLVIYDTPKELSELKVINPDVASIGSFGWAFNEKELPKFIPIKKAPQSWCYVWEK